jgi:Txe/YoeB family toxin of toxin-antitoxin system
MYDIRLTKKAQKDSVLAERAGMKKKIKEIINVVREDPFKNPPPYESLIGDRLGSYSRRINRQHRFVYEVLPNTENLKDENDILFDGIVKIIRMWTHYE